MCWANQLVGVVNMASCSGVDGFHSDKPQISVDLGKSQVKWWLLEMLSMSLYVAMDCRCHACERRVCCFGPSIALVGMAEFFCSHRV